MALANYTDLINSINGSAAWLHRADLSSIAPDWIRLCEDTVNYGDLEVVGVDGLRTGDQETSWTSASTVPATTTAQSQTVTLPTDFLEMRTLRLLVSGTTGWELVQRPTLPIPIGTLTQSPGPPRTYMVSGNTIVFDRPCDQPYNMAGLYYAKVPALTASAPTNWLMTKAPKVYLYGSIAHGAPWLGPTFNPAPWIAGFKMGLAQVRRSDARARHSNSTMRTEAAAVTGTRGWDWRTGGL